MSEPIKTLSRNMFLYNLLLFLFLVPASPVLLVMLLCSEKRRASFLFKAGVVLPGCLRRGRVGQDRERVWVHALSVGEVMSAVPLVKILKKKHPHRAIFFSASTRTGFEVAQKQLGQSRGTVAGVFYFPFDFYFSVKRVLSAVSPHQVIVVEGDLWPNFLHLLHKNKIPVSLVNARLSERSFKGYRLFSFFLVPLLSVFAKICCQTKTYADRFLDLGLASEKLASPGNIKFDQREESLPESEIKKLRMRFRVEEGQPLFMAGSTHRGEEAALCQAFAEIRKKHPQAVLVVAPRDPGRAGEVVQVFESRGFSAVALKHLADFGPSPDVIVIDVIGLLRNLYAAADVVFIGGSLSRDGGHNPLEPAAHAKPVIFGSDMSDFAEIARSLVAGGGAFCVSNAEELADAAVRLLSCRKTAGGMGRRAHNIFKENSGAIERTLDLIGC